MLDAESRKVNIYDSSWRLAHRRTSRVRFATSGWSLFASQDSTPIASQNPLGTDTVLLSGFFQGSR